jgi:hypothetical protein
LFGAFAPREAWWRSASFKAGLLTAVAFTIVAFVSYAVAPDWMWMYFLEPSKVAWALPGIGVGYLSMFTIGYSGAVGLRPLGRRIVAGAALGAVAAELTGVAITWSRYHLVGTRREWLAGRAHELLTLSPSGPVVTIGLLGPAFVAVFAVALFVTWRSSRAAPAGR